MYICETCGGVFEKPTVAIEAETLEGYRREMRTESCPHCDSPYFEEAKQCICGNWRPLWPPLCGDCREELRTKFQGFIGELEKDEVTQLDHWLDGMSVESSENWK